MIYTLKNKATLVIVFCAWFIVLKSQDDLTNHKKYWYYKTRLNNDFIKINNSAPSGINNADSPDHGESIPMNERVWEDNSGVYSNSYLSKIMKAGDAGTRLGIYISVLATEYRLLKNNGQDVTKIKHEIFCSLNAVNRIDYYAESIFSNNSMAPNLNGFFIRDDVPPGFIKRNYNHFNYYFSNNQANDRGFTQFNPLGQDSIMSDYSDFLKTSIIKGKEESQDQAYYLLMGLALTSKLVDGGEVDGSNVFGYGSGETELRKEAINIANRIINHIKGNNLPGWKIKNPANGYADVQIGANAVAYAYPLDNSGCYIKYGQEMPFVFISPAPGPLFGINYPYNICFDYRNITSLSTTAATGWKTIAQVGGGPTVDMQGFFNTLAGICNCVYEDKKFINVNVQTAISNVLAQINNLNNAMYNAVQSFLSGLPSYVSQSLQWVINKINQINAYFITAINALNSLYNNLLSQLTPTFLTNTTDERLVQNTINNNVIYETHPGCNNNNVISANHLGSDAYFGIYLRDVLHSTSYNTQLPSWLQYFNAPPTLGHFLVKAQMTNILNTAPCQGNYRMFPNIPSPNWGASNRIDRMDPLWRSNCGDGNQGEYAGLDYMLLHNLFYLREGTTNSIVDYSDRRDNRIMPIGSTFINGNKGTLGAFEFLKSANYIASNGAVDYRAGKEISLLDGFSAQQGADVSAYISPFQCSGVSDQMNKTTNPQNDFYDEPTNYVSKPLKNNVSDAAAFQHIASPDESAINEFNKQLDSLINNFDFNDTDVLTTKIFIYPNPSSGEFNINFNLTNEDNVELSIYDVLGKEIYNYKHIIGYTNLPINLTDISKGIYFAKFINSNGEEDYRKITIQ